jgi:hypothetical protein
MRRVRTGYEYDPVLDITASKEGRKRLAIFNNAPQWKKEIWLAKAHASSAKKRAPLKAAKLNQQAVREAAEEETAETVRMLVRAVVFSLQRLQDIPAPNQYKRAVNVKALHNTVLLLKQKCGIYFPPEEMNDEFCQRLALDHNRTPVKEDY